MRDHKVAGQLPLTPLAFHILLALLDGDLHGYGVLKEIDLITRGQMAPTVQSCRTGLLTTPATVPFPSVLLCPERSPSHCSFA